MQMNRNILIGLVLVIAVLFLLGSYMWNQNQGDMIPEAGEVDEAGNVEAYENQPAPQGDGYLPNSSPQEVGQPTDVVEPMNPSVCYPKDQLTPEELLPQDYSSTWAKCNPTGAGSLEGKNFLDAGHHIGINTVGQTLRNANLQLRSEPPNPQVKVSPWVQSTIEPDTNRRYMEVGNC